MRLSGSGEDPAAKGPRRVDLVESVRDGVHAELHGLVKGKVFEEQFRSSHALAGAAMLVQSYFVLRDQVIHRDMPVYDTAEIAYRPLVRGVRLSDVHQRKIC